MMGSPFYQPPPVPGELPHVDPVKIESTLLAPLVRQPNGPSERELQDWYYEVDTIANERGIPRHVAERLLDLRDEIYRFLH